jgi:hypothetical protein
VAGQYVNLGRLRELAREALAAQAEPAPAPAPEAEPASVPIAQPTAPEGGRPVRTFRPGSADGPYLAGDGIALWSFETEALARRAALAIAAEGVEPYLAGPGLLGFVALPMPALADAAPQPSLPGEARPGAARPDARPVLPGEAEPPAPIAQDGPVPELPRLRADAAAGRPVSLATLARALAGDLATPAPTPDSLRARAAVRGAEAERLAGAEPTRAQVAADHAQTLTAWADSLSPSPVADAWAGQPWDPGTPDARARVALQGERVAALWPIAQAVRGAGFDLPPVWWADGPILAGEWRESAALAVLSTDRLKAAAAALAALPPVTTAQARALAACRQALACDSRPV